jgi:triacylglycerol esterase/lipase EstA (alpha/beta hydrolase family)
LTQYPVLLVPGWHDGARRLHRLERYLIRSGWSEHAVHSVDFADCHGSNVEHAAEIANALRVLAARNSADRVDIVAHSMGGLAVRYLLHTRPEAPLVRRAVFLGTPHRGTYAAYLAWGAGGRDMRIGSPFLTKLESFSAPVNTELFCIRTPLDLRLIPPVRGTLAGAQNITVWCGGHRLLLHSRRVREVVKGILRTTFALLIAFLLVVQP